MNQAVENIKAAAASIPAHVSVDQEPDKDEDQEMDALPAAVAPEREPEQSAPDSMVGVAEGVIGVITNLKGGTIPIKAAPGGVWTAITLEFNNAVKELSESMGDKGLADLLILSEVKDIKTETANKMRDAALDGMFRESLPRLMEAIASKAPETLAKIVALIIEPDTRRIRDSKPLTYSVQDVLWDIAITEQVEALLIFVESLRLGDIKKKALGFLGK